ncbi:hypothetical protein [Rhodococcus sp. IEGM 1379]|uniref:DUF7171 family protein n=1 Tax=Rhodococcus sp. IEGM 1379 TaxID=3047086 RepID=UPI0024B7EBF4|nr:hypothetical protein [Rhodococcus sp. IEGM 1379]MDI9914390.1 hypothetical protein [Rhodococcus sp. IEGM 1379]
MAIVKDNPNGDKGTVEGMAKYSFMSSPPEQFEHIPVPGERRVMSVTVQCKAVIDEEVDEGVRKHVKWKIVEAEIGTMAHRAETTEPTLDYESGESGEYGDYGTGAPANMTGAEDNDSVDDTNESSDAGDEPADNVHAIGGPKLFSE